MFKYLLLIPFNYPQALGKRLKCKVGEFVVILHPCVQKEEEIYAGIVIICHIFKPQVPNCGFSVIASLLDCLHRGLQTVMELYSKKCV